jgi:hypothetical protein
VCERGKKAIEMCEMRHFFLFSAPTEHVTTGARHDGDLATQGDGRHDEQRGAAAPTGQILVGGADCAPTRPQPSFGAARVWTSG